jgi:hypothetical protein
MCVYVCTRASRLPRCIGKHIHTYTYTLIRRDCAPAVRGRALSALHDLLLSLKSLAAEAQALTLNPSTELSNLSNPDNPDISDISGGYGGFGVSGELLSGAIGAGHTYIHT